MNSETERHSWALEVELISDPAERAKQEARNGLRQFDEVIERVEFWLQPERPFRLRPSGILGLHRKALEGISSFAGVWRPAAIEIGGSSHNPPGAHLVAELIEQMCDYVNENWVNSPVHLAAYVLWRMNWIHPFVDGNGRTARALSYLVLSVRLGCRLPGTNTIPDQIASDKTPYYQALEAADRAFSEGKIDVSRAESLLGDLLAKQFASVLRVAKASAVLRDQDQAV
jgi:fido (protein-threonine AMPylation protein)